MVRTPYRIALLMLGAVSLLLFDVPRAHASWVSHWLGLDHHTSAPAPTPLPTLTPAPPPVVLTTYVQPAPVTVVQSYAPAPAATYTPIPAATYAATSAPVPVTLPVTGPGTNLSVLALLAILSTAATVYASSYFRLRKAIRSIDIL